MAKQKIKKFTTPVGEIVLGFIQRPSKEYSKDPRGDYAIKLAYTGQEDGFPAFKEWVDSVAQKAHAAAVEAEGKARNYSPHSLLQPELADDGKPTGRMLFSASQPGSWPSGDERLLPVLARNGQPWPSTDLIGKGSTASISFSLGKPYNMPDRRITGVKPYLQGVMIFDYVAYTQNSAASLGFTVDPSYGTTDDMFEGGDSGGGGAPDVDF